MDTLAIRLGRRLRELRGDEPQLQFAKKLGISKSSLNRMELGEQNVSLKTLDTLCRRLKVEVGELFAD
jgi:transcriptional regulator with XRE-family HTH domain